MKIILALLLAGVSAPALAQSEPAAPAAAPSSSATCLPEHAAMGHCTLPATAKPVAPAGSATCLPEHAAMGHCTLSRSDSPTGASCSTEQRHLLARACRDGSLHIARSGPSTGAGCSSEQRHMLPRARRNGPLHRSGNARPETGGADPHAGHDMSARPAAPASRAPACRRVQRSEARRRRFLRRGRVSSGARTACGTSMATS